MEYSNIMAIIDYEIFEALVKVPIFSELDEQTLKVITQIGVIRTDPAGFVLFRQGERGDEFYAILKGSLRVSAETEDGQSLTLAVLGPGESFGEMALLDDVHRSATVEVVEECRLLVIDRKSFNSLLHARPEVALMLLRNLSRRLRQRTVDIADIAYLDVYRRLSRRLLQLANEQSTRWEDGIHITPPLTIDTLSTMIGADPEGVTYLLAMLENDGTLSHVDDHVVIHDLHRLHERFFSPRVLRRAERTPL